MRPFASLLSLTLIGCLSSAVFAVDYTPELTDPDKQGPDFKVQGEYVGDLKLDAAPAKFGAQVIALGDGNFQIALTPGGLPGDGWMRSEESHKSNSDDRVKADGKTEGNATTFKGPKWTAKISDGAAVFTNTAGDTIGTLTKVERHSPTLGEKPPAGAVVLFDGSNADQFNNGRVVLGNLLGVGTTSKPPMRNFKLHLEFRTPYMPTARGQGRGNSGLYLQGRYEVQVLDSFGLKGENNECGGIYSQTSPKVNMCLPPLSWQTYDVDFTEPKYEGDKKVANARVTVSHNGVKVYDNLEVKAATPGGVGEASNPLGFMLQDHGNPVVYRNIWFVEK